MTELLEQAVEFLRRMPPAAQDEMAQAILLLRADEGMAAIAPEHLPFVLEGLAQIERGEFATDEEVAALLRSADP